MQPGEEGVELGEIAVCVNRRAAHRRGCVGLDDKATAHGDDVKREAADMTRRPRIGDADARQGKRRGAELAGKIVGEVP